MRKSHQPLAGSCSVLDRIGGCFPLVSKSSIEPVSQKFWEDSPIKLRNRGTDMSRPYTKLKGPICGMIGLALLLDCGCNIRKQEPPPAEASVNGEAISTPEFYSALRLASGE